MSLAKHVGTYSKLPSICSNTVNFNREWLFQETAE